MRVIHSRIIVVNVVLVLAAVLAFVASITIGDHPITLEKVFEVFMGGGTRLQRTVVLKWRLHRAVAAVAVGLALGLAGALTQSVTRNPLASPDVLGISQGASACAVTIIVLGSGTMGAVSLPVAALIGSTLAAVVIWLLGSRRGMDTFRLVLSGIMITALLQSYITWLLLRADISDAAIAKTWLTGSLVASSADRNLPVLLVLLSVWNMSVKRRREAWEQVASFAVLPPHPRSAWVSRGLRGGRGALGRGGAEGDVPAGDGPAVAGPGGHGHRQVDDAGLHVAVQGRLIGEREQHEGVPAGDQGAGASFFVRDAEFSGGALDPRHVEGLGASAMGQP